MTVLYLFSTPSPVRGSASRAVKWVQLVVSLDSVGSEAALTSVAETDSSPNKVGWVVSDDVDIGVEEMRSCCLVWWSPSMSAPLFAWLVLHTSLCAESHRQAATVTPRRIKDTDAHCVFCKAHSSNRDAFDIVWEVS